MPRQHKKLIIVRRPLLLARSAAARSSHAAPLSRTAILETRCGAMAEIEKQNFARNLVNLVVKKATLRLPCGSRITRLIENRKQLSPTLWSKTKLLIGKKSATKEKNRLPRKDSLQISRLIDCSFFSCFL